MKNTQPKIHTVFQIMQGLKFLHGEKHFGSVYYQLRQTKTVSEIADHVARQLGA
jgi:hypothetical protein